MSTEGGTPADLAQAIEDAVGMVPAAPGREAIAPRLQAFVALLLERNRQINLVSRRDTDRHVARFTRECLFLARLLFEERQAVRAAPRLLDIGSGNGFPGLVVKIAMPDLDVDLVEGTRKKARFLEEAVERLELPGIRVHWGRAEDLARRRGDGAPAVRARGFDWVTGKGLGSVRESTELAGPFLVPGGVHWTFKGKACRTEIEAASGVFRKQGFAVHRLEPIPGSEDSWVVGIRRLAK